MPVSSHEGKAWFEGLYAGIRPATVVDIGAGEGIYAMRLRPLWRSRWLAIEAWEPYVERFGLEAKYDVVWTTDAHEVELPEADLYIAGDVLEHMDRVYAVDLIERIKARTRHLFVSVPIIEIHQGAVNGNPYEEHKHHWTFEEMHAVLDNCASWRGEVIGAYHWERGM